MSTNIEAIDARTFRIRHVHPGTGEGATQTILGKIYGFTELPLSHIPTSHDLVEGSYSTRLGDSGEFTLTFPNTAGSKGLWRERFNPDKSLEFIEIYRDDVLEFVGSIQRIEVDEGTVTISGPDAWGLVKRAYEQDRLWTAAPRDVLEQYTKVPVPIVVDDFLGTSLEAAWTQDSGQTVSVSGGLATFSPNNPLNDNDIGFQRSLSALGDTWKVTLVVARATQPYQANVQIWNGVNPVAGVAAGSGIFQVFSNDNTGSNLITRWVANYINPLPATLVLERQGRWLFGYVNGRLAGVVPYQATAHTILRITSLLPSSGTPSVSFDSITLVEQEPFLARGSDKGSYVLPTDLPTGGLRGRYYNNADLQGDTSNRRKGLIMSPVREHYGERLDTSIAFEAGLTPIQPGTSGDYFSVKWFGAIYLRPDLGNYQFRLTNVDDGARLWVAKTAWGEQLLDGWIEGAGTIGPATLTGIGSQPGWYPIIVEYYETGGGNSIRLEMNPPASYTDPGGASITGNIWDAPNPSSLSPLGCYDNRIQGQSHFDILQQVAQEFGYQLHCEPMQLESGEFPGRLVPRIRVGRDTDVMLEVDDGSSEPIISPGVTLDATDQTVVLIGKAQGLPDSQSGQVTAEVVDLGQLSSFLFAHQTWLDAGDISFPDLLQARLNAELALRATPWEEVRGTPRAQERLADTWPLSGALSAMRWRPGDGVRLYLPPIGVEDTDPRQILQVTRSFQAEGRTQTQLSFRQRPRSAAKSVRTLLKRALAPARSYQGQKVTLQSQITTAPAAGTWTGYEALPIFPGDQIVFAQLRIVLNNNNQPLQVEINASNPTTGLGGPWSLVPTYVDVTGYAQMVSGGAANPGGDGRMYWRLFNGGGVGTTLDAVIILEVLR